MVDHISLPLTKLITMGKFDTLERGSLGRGSREEDERKCRQTSEAGADDEKSNVADNPRSSADESVRLDESRDRAAADDSDDDSSKVRRRSHVSFRKFPIMAPLGIGEKRNPFVKKLLSDPNSNMRRYLEMRKKGKFKEHKSSKTEHKSSTSEVIQSSDDDVFGGDASCKAQSSVEQKGFETDSSHPIHPEPEKEDGVQKMKGRKNESSKIKVESSDAKKKLQDIPGTPEPKQHVGAKKTLKPSGTANKKSITQEPTETYIPQKSSPNYPSSSMKEVPDDSIPIDPKDNQTPRNSTESPKKAQSSRSRKSMDKSDESKGSRNRKEKIDPIVHKKKAEEKSPSFGSYHKKSKHSATQNYREKVGKDTFPAQATEMAAHKPRHFSEKHSYPRPQIRPCLLMKSADNSENNEDYSDEPSTSQRKRKSSDDDEKEPEKTYSAPDDHSEPSTSSGTSVKHPWNDTDEVLLREEKRRRLEALFRVTEKAIAEVSSPSTPRVAPREQEQDGRQEKRRRLITPSQILKGKEQMAGKSLQRKKSHHKHGKERSCLEHKVKLITPSQILKGKKRSEEEKTERIESRKFTEGKVKGYFPSDDEVMEATSESAAESKESAKKRRREKKKSKKRSESKERSHKSKKGKKKDKKQREAAKYEVAKNDEGSADEESAELFFREKKPKVKRSESVDPKKGGGKEFRGMPGNVLTGNPIVNKPAKSYQKKKVQDNAHLADHDLIDDRFTIRKL